MCKVLKICRNTYYNRLRWVPSPRELDCQKLDKEIQTIYYECKRRYGAPKIHKVLISNGRFVSLKRVQRHMTVLGLRSILVKKYRHYPNNNQQVIERENISKQDFSTTGINQKWCTDITYIHTLKDGWTYLASVMDFYRKKIIGWAYGTSMTANLALRAVENACLNASNPTGIILHSDLGTQYTSDLFEKYLFKHSLLKKEEVHKKTYIDSKDAFTAILEYIESWYNHKRIHISLNYQTPDAVYQDAIGAA